MRRQWWAVGLLLAAPATAEVTRAESSGFVSEHKVRVAAPPEAVYRSFGQVGRWWNPEHSYSGDATNLRLELRAGGCFCETVPATRATVEHMRVVYAEPGAMLRLSGALGPLQAEGVAGSLTWSLRPVDGGTEVTQTYVVGGLIRSGSERIAPAVDQVLGDQLARLQRLHASPGR